MKVCFKMAPWLTLLCNKREKGQEWPSKALQMKFSFDFSIQLKIENYLGKFSVKL